MVLIGGMISFLNIITDLLGMPVHVRVDSIVGIGHPAEVRRALPAGRLEYDKVRYNRYSTVWER